MKKQFVSGMMASALIFSYGAGAAFANEDPTGTSTEETLETVELNEGGTTTETTETTTEETTETTTEETTEDTTSEESTEEVTEDTATEEDVVEEPEVKEEAPSLVPGDFFYFVKTFMEKIRLAVTVDDYKEAQLLAEFAAERISEANTLIAEGKTEEATELLQKAIETQTAATEELEKVEGTEETTEETTIEEGSEELTEEAEVVEESTEEVVALDEPTTTEEDVKVEVKLGQNIDALLSALSHVENPRAQQALMKNIQKSFAKLDKKIAKLEKKYGTEVVVEEDTTLEEDTVTDETTTEETVATEEGTETETTEEVTEVEEETVVAATAPAKAVEKKQQAKAKAEEKKQQGQAKAQEKKQQAQEKKQQGQAKAQEKKNNKGNGNGNK